MLSVFTLQVEERLVRRHSEGNGGDDGNGEVHRPIFTARKALGEAGHADRIRVKIVAHSLVCVSASNSLRASQELRAIAATMQL